jgi:hypothetical protein
MTPQRESVASPIKDITPIGSDHVDSTSRALPPVPSVTNMGEPPASVNMSHHGMGPPIIHQNMNAPPVTTIDHESMGGPPSTIDHQFFRPPGPNTIEDGR